MAASDATVQEVARIIKKHVPIETVRLIVNDLQEVRGNASFRETIARLTIALVAK